MWPTEHQTPATGGEKNGGITCKNSHTDYLFRVCACGMISSADQVPCKILINKRRDIIQ